MMKNKRVLAVLLSAVICLAALPTAAAEILDAGVPYISGQIAPDEVWAAGPNVPMQQMFHVTDGNPYTHWNAAAGGAQWLAQNYLMLSFRQSQTVSSVWVRTGDYTSPEAYYSAERPTQISIQFWTRSGSGSNMAAEYGFQLDDVYRTSTYISGWDSGYQQLVLPAPVDNVMSIVIRIGQHTGSAYSQQVIISDIAVCGSVDSPPSYTYPVYPTQAPATQPPASGSGITAVLLQKMATRSGPSTRYTEPGTFLAKGDTVQVISLAYDNNDVPWVQVDFTAYGGRRRAYTGLKRVDLQAWQIPEERPLNRGGYMRQEITPRMGPGYNYMTCKDTVLYSGESVVVLAQENSWLQIEISREGMQPMRVWVQSSAVAW